ncbi:hypothetical protein [Bordetella genomosp. 11]|uniref:Uncharacterized protein n=1 Tax=Bordetella genomosp. 11 TaxID=1416808 RepID=A0A261UMJ5_9BORD|nr:hypothetical protein [Bordetella genomosp. 11]OZI62113.1 hypothetical protein CAL28_23090 [Bordetella genomosp. 11]
MELNRDFVERFKDEYEKKKSAYLIWNSIESKFEKKLLTAQEFQTLSRSFSSPSLESARKLLQRFPRNLLYTVALSPGFRRCAVIDRFFSA